MGAAAEPRGPIRGPICLLIAMFRSAVHRHGDNDGDNFRVPRLVSGTIGVFATAL